MVRRVTVRSLRFKFEGVAMRGFCSLLSVLACSLWLIPAAQAQSGKGAIAGHVTDSSGGALIGAQAAVQPGGVNVASDGRGQFFVNDLDPGSYTVTVTYVGFEPFTQTLDVTAGRAASVDAKLEVESVSLKVLVTAERASCEAEAINREITADNIVQVLPADVIRSLPNANMADALGRLPSVTITRDEGEGKYVQVRGTEPRLTNTTIDGINVPSPESGVRQIKFDAIPADIVESVEINKTLQANMDGDGIGGSVNLVTKTAGEHPTVNISGMGGYTPILGGRGLIETTGTVGHRFGAGGNDANFDLIEKVSAGYVMNTFNFTGHIRLVAGVRIEGTNLDTNTFQTVTDSSGNTTSGFVRRSGSYVNVLPSASLRFALTNNTNLRLVYSRGLARPNPQDMAQAGTADDTANPVIVSIGNPNLKAERADNVDILIEHSINPFGLIEAGYFYKNLTDPIVTHTCNPPATCPGFPPTTVVTQPLNAGSAWINGFEAAYIQHLTFLPGMLRGLGFSGNYGYTASRASLGPDFSRSDHPRLLRNAPHTWNVSPTYDRGRVSIRVGLSYNAANIAAYGFTDGAPGGITGPFGDNYFYAHLQVDAQGSVRMARGLSLVMYCLNLNNEVFGFYNGSPQFMVQREFYKPTVAAGFRWSPLHER